MSENVAAGPKTSEGGAVPMDWCRCLGCSTRVRIPRIFCSQHWAKVPPEMQATVFLAWRTKWWEEAVDKAVAHVAAVEGYRRKVGK